MFLINLKFIFFREGKENSSGVKKNRVVVLGLGREGFIEGKAELLTVEREEPKTTFKFAGKFMLFNLTSDKNENIITSERNDIERTERFGINIEERNTIFKFNITIEENTGLGNNFQRIFVGKNKTASEKSERAGGIVYKTDSGVHSSVVSIIVNFLQQLTRSRRRMGRYIAV